MKFNKLVDIINKEKMSVYHKTEKITDFYKLEDELGR